MTAMEPIECDAVVVGAGAIGLAIAAELSQRRSVIVIDHHAKFGQETSSRNSEVIHSGIYYPLGSKKTEWCIAGRGLLYAFCAANRVPFAKVGKYVVATISEEEAYLAKLESHCRSLDVPVERRTQSQIHRDEPLISVTSGVYLPETGIVDSHVLMQVLENQIVDRGGTMAYRHRLLSAARSGGHWLSEIDSGEGPVTIKSPWLVNAAGLAAAEVTSQVLQTKRYEHRYCRGRYFSLPAKYQGKFKRLIYPVPPKDGLGIHITVDLAGQARLGPDVDWCKDSNYSGLARHYDCDWEGLRSAFTAAAARYFPSIMPHEVSPGLIGVRPKLFLDGVAAPDFLVENHDGFVHCLGIESPGLTSSLAIASEVGRLVG